MRSDIFKLEKKIKYFFLFPNFNKAIVSVPSNTIAWWKQFLNRHQYSPHDTIFHVFIYYYHKKNWLKIFLSMLNLFFISLKDFGLEICRCKYNTDFFSSVAYSLILNLSLNCWWKTHHVGLLSSLRCDLSHMAS